MTVEIKDAETEKMLEKLCAATGMTAECLISEGLRQISGKQIDTARRGKVSEQEQQRRREAIRRMQELYASLPPGKEPNFRLEDMYDEDGLPA